MTSPSDIRIPAELLPRDGRFGAGPSKLRREQLEALLADGSTYMGTSHRQNTVKSKVGEVREGLTSLFNLPEGYEVLLGNGGSTCSWDAATFHLVRQQSQNLNLGGFASTFTTPVKRDPPPSSTFRRAKKFCRARVEAPASGPPLHFPSFANRANPSTSASSPQSSPPPLRMHRTSMTRRSSSLSPVRTPRPSLTKPSTSTP